MLYCDPCTDVCRSQSTEVGCGLGLAKERKSSLVVNVHRHPNVIIMPNEPNLTPGLFPWVIMVNWLVKAHTTMLQR